MIQALMVVASNSSPLLFDIYPFLFIIFFSDGEGEGNQTHTYMPSRHERGVRSSVYQPPRQENKYRLRLEANLDPSVAWTLLADRSNLAFPCLTFFNQYSKNDTKVAVRLLVPKKAHSSRLIQFYLHKMTRPTGQTPKIEHIVTTRPTGQTVKIENIVSNYFTQT